MRKLLIPLVILAGAQPALAQKGEPEAVPVGQMCTNADGRQSTTIIIDACTKLIGFEKDLSAADRSQMLVQRANAYLKEKRDAEALKDYDAAVKLDPKNAIAYMMRGVFHLHTSKNFPQAAKDVDQAIALNAKLAPPYQTRAQLRMQTGNIDGAIADQTQYIGLMPAKAEGYRDRGTLYIVKQDFAKAAADYDAALQRTPGQTPARAELLNGACFARAAGGKELDKAKADCDLAIKLVPRQAAYHDSRALVAFRQGRLSEAWDDWNRAATLDQTGAGYIYGRGVASLRLKRKAEGDADVARATKMNPGVAAEYQGYGVAP